MKKILIIFLVILLMGSFAFGQEFNPPVKGEKAMLFGFSGLGFLGVLEYQGGYGYKMFLSNSMALRLALMLDYNNTMFYSFSFLVKHLIWLNSNNYRSYTGNILLNY